MLIMKGFEPILTERLFIRKLETNDAQDFYKYRSLPEVYKFQSFNPKNTKDIKVFFKRLSELPNSPNTWFQLAVCVKDENKLIGDIGIHFLEDDEQTEIGYTLNPDFQGVGYAKEAVTAVIRYLFKVLGKHRIIASVDPDNEKSIKLLDKIGMRREAYFVKSIKINGIWSDDCIYAILKEEYIDA
jgi:RimJ/RimL family protein N-acetyltransferase